MRMYKNLYRRNFHARAPLEVVAGEYLGGNEAIGLVGRVWLDINTIKKHYLSLTARSKRIQNIRDKIARYARQFSGYEKMKNENSPRERNRYVKF